MLVEEIWVNVEEGAERTGYNIDYVRRLARNNLRLPEAERALRVRRDTHAYAIWLPDLISYFQKIEDGQPKNPEEEIWVNTNEAAEIMGYNRDYLSQLGLKMMQKPEEEREIKTKKRGGNYEMWLPDLRLHQHRGRRGPRSTSKKPLDQ